MTIESVAATACTIPTPEPESDGTIAWDATTIVLVEARADGHTGVGYTYGDAAVADLVERVLAGHVLGTDAMATERSWWAMVRAVRNLGRPGIAAHAISAIDVALWDLKARLLGLPLFRLLGAARERVAIYGSGGFCSMDDDALAGQLSGWARAGIGRVKMKVGRDPAADDRRVVVARAAVGDEVELMVDANGAWTVSRPWTARIAGGPITASPGSRSRCRATTSAAWPACAPGLPPAWRSPPGSTATPPTSSRGCSTPARSTSCRPT